MALTEATFLQNPAQQAAAAMFAPATNMLGDALNNAVDMGRRMVDLQSHQEDMFMSEREKLRLASERKGLEAQRIFEADRKFGEDVLKDRRNFAEDAFRDRRDFTQSSMMQNAQLGMSRERLAMEKENAAAGRTYNEARAQYYLNGGTKAGDGKSFGVAFSDVLTKHGALETTITPPRDVTMSPRDYEAMAQQNERAVKSQGGWAPVLQSYYREDATAALPSMSPEQREILTPMLPLFQQRKPPTQGRAQVQQQYGLGTDVTDYFDSGD